MSDLDLLLLGKTGAGKSATGNSILRRKAFRSLASTSSVTYETRQEITRLDDGRILKVVDTPGLLDTRGTENEAEELFLKAIKEAIVMNPRGYHVFILILRFGGRFTQEDFETINFLKELFGGDFVMKYCIIVLTYGDQFQMLKDNGDIKQSFSDWCKEQQGRFKELCDEVNHRLVLFSNYGNDGVKAAQLNELLNVIHENKMTDRRYSNSMFQEALQAYKKAVAIPTKNFVSQFHMEKTSLLMFDIIQIKNLSDIDVRISKFEEVSEKVNTYLRDLLKEKSENKNNIALEKITSVVWNAKCQIDQEIMMLKMDKLSAVEQKPQELNVQQQKDQHLKKVVEEYLEWRDQNDNNKAMSLYDILAWPFRKIRDWLKRFKI